MVRRLQSGDERAFRDLVSQEGDRIYNLCFRMLRNQAEAEEITQEVFIVVFKKIGVFRGDSKLSTWIYRITVNHCKNRLEFLARRGAGKSVEYTEARLAKKSAEETAGPGAALELAELSQELEHALAELDEEKRMLIILRDMEELSYEEISQIMDIPKGTVKSRIHRARKSLRECLEKSGRLR